MSRPSVASTKSLEFCNYLTSQRAVNWKGYCLTDEEARDGLPELGNRVESLFENYLTYSYLSLLHLLDADLSSVLHQ